MADLQELEKQLDEQAAKAKGAARENKGSQRDDEGKSADQVAADRDARKKAKIAAKEARKAAAAAKKAATAAAKNETKKGSQKKEKKEKKEKNETTEVKEVNASAEVSPPTERTGGERRSSVIDKVKRPMMQFDDPKKYAKYVKKQILQRTKLQEANQVALFSHLPQYEPESSLSLQVGFSAEELHPSFVRLGLKFAEGTIKGSNARCLALLNAFKDFIKDYKTPPNKELSRDLNAVIKPLIRFIIDCRPQSISMGNALRYLKSTIAKLSPSLPEEEAKELLISKIDSFIQERIEYADLVIATLGSDKINDGDVVLTYAKSHVVEMIIKKAFDDGKQFKVIIVDARPHLEGKELMRKLTAHGLKCSYILINGLSYVMQEVSKVFLGAHAMLANGALISRLGCAVVGMMAHTYKVPLLVCCETYKFHERTQLDSIGINELGDPDALICTTDRDDASHSDVLADWRDISQLKLLNLTYDLTPAEFVSMVITEHGMIPPTSVPVVLREYHKDTANAS